MYTFTVRVLKSIELVGYLLNILISPDVNNNNNNISYNIAHCSRTRTGTVGIYTHANTVHLYIFITIMQVVFTRRPNDMIMFFSGEAADATFNRKRNAHWRPCSRVPMATTTASERVRRGRGERTILL